MKLSAGIVWVGTLLIGMSAWNPCVIAANPVAIQTQDEAGNTATESPDLWSRENLVAWCIVPFDAKRRGPEARAAMLDSLGIGKLAYDYRAEHVPTFDAEVEALKKHGIELTAWWFPGELNAEAQKILEVLRRHDVQTQLWITGGGGPTATPEEQQARVEAEAKRVRRIAEAAAEIGCQVGLYNHGGWFGEPENQIAIIEHLGMSNVGIVYNQHHGHDHVDKFADLLVKMKPYLLAVNLNGMARAGDTSGKKILPIGAGELDYRLLKTLEASGYRGPIGILNHTSLDAELRLQDNLDGLKYVVQQLRGKAITPPVYRSFTGAPVVPPNDVHELRNEVEQANQLGNATRGMTVFASLKYSCLACHKIGKWGGSVGPEMGEIGKKREPWQIVESIRHPQRIVEESYRTTRILTVDGEIINGYVLEATTDRVRIKDPSSGEEREVLLEDIEAEQQAGSVMPEGLLDGMRPQQRHDLYAFLFDLGHGKKVEPQLIDSVLKHWAASEPATFEYDLKPIDPKNWTQLHQSVNRDRLFQYYTKQAEHFRQQDFPPPLLAEFPGLDGLRYGHWGNQNESGWKDARWNETTLGTVQCGVFRGAGRQIRRGVCLQLGNDRELFACFNPEALRYEVVWRGEFLDFSDVRHGFMDGLLMAGEVVEGVETPPVQQPFEYHGFYRFGPRVVFSYAINGIEYLDAPWVEAGEFVRVKAPRDEHPLRHVVDGGAPQWPQTMHTDIEFGDQEPYAIDNIAIPSENPWNALVFGAGLDFLPGGDAIVTTMQGDVWRVSGLDAQPDKGALSKATWRRIAGGLQQALGVVAEEDAIYVLGRDRLTKLQDVNGDGEMDFYESFCNSFDTSPGGHDFICGLQRDQDGYFYTASSNQGLVRISPDGKRADIVATGFRNPDGVGVYPDGTVTIPCSEGQWTPASMICARRPNSGQPFFGYRGPRDGKPPALPLVYLPRGVDNSSGGQIYIDSDQWGPVQGEGNMVHTSFGAGTYMLLLRDEVGEQIQGAVVPMPGDFRAGVHRARFRQQDGQLYVVGMAGWGSYTTDDGCLQRVRYTGGEVVQPVAFHVHSNGVLVRFSAPLDKATAEDPSQHFAQCWNYRYSSVYGSPEYSASHAGVRGHDVLAIDSAHVLEDGQTVFLEIPDLQLVNQLHLRLYPRDGMGRDLFATIHAMDTPFTSFPGYRPDPKEIYPHPILADISRAVDSIPNPYTKEIEGARAITVRVGTNLAYETRRIEVKAGEPLKLTLNNPDVVPHNWALLKPGSTQRVGEAANRLVGDPDGAARQYVPETDAVLAYTDVVEPKQKFTIQFHAPEEPGVYPYICTFPGHWMVMQGQLVVK